LNFLEKPNNELIKADLALKSWLVTGRSIDYSVFSFIRLAVMQFVTAFCWMALLLLNRTVGEILLLGSNVLHCHGSLLII
jgi:hypothetical protein